MASQVGPDFHGDWREVLTGSEFVTAVQVGDHRPTLTITSIKRARLDSLDAGGGSRDALVVYFGEAEKGWVLNKTNAKCLSAMFGNRVDDWIGKRVTLCTEMVGLGRERVLGIRVVGSPDIARPIVADVTRPRRRKETRELVPTGRNPKHEPAPNARGEGL